MKNRNKLPALLMSIVLCVTFTACGSAGDGGDKSSSAAKDTTTTTAQNGDTDGTSPFIGTWVEQPLNLTLNADGTGHWSYGTRPFSWKPDETQKDGFDYADVHLNVVFTYEDGKNEKYLFEMVGDVLDVGYYYRDDYQNMESRMFTRDVGAAMDANFVVGKWLEVDCDWNEDEEKYEIKENGEEALNQFNEDGTFVLRDEYGEYFGTWTVEGDKLHLTTSFEGETYTMEKKYYVVDGQLILESDDTFQRVLARK
ncbi:MAG: hypothetical protein IJB36_06770 [Clostridia bacterium]|nr:hypothetical protein [Clostridia bacterium]